MEQGWVDYYNILQVNQQAERDAIEARYRMLCKVYHPDINPSPDAEGRMKMINLAWEVLKDDSKRKAYHREWMRRNPLQFNPSASPSPTWRAPRRPGAAHTQELAARRAISQYFRGIIDGNYAEVYALLSERDRKNIPLDSFIRWQKSVAASYHIERFLVLTSKKYDAFPMDEIKCSAERFLIEITEKDLRSGESVCYKLVKFAIKEEDEWHIYLGYRDIEYIVERFSMMSGMVGEAMARSIDPLTGLPNRQGFLEKCRAEVYRFERYGRGFVLCAATTHFGREYVDTDLNRRILQQVGCSLRATARLIDVVGALGQERFCLLLAETGPEEARRAATRLARKVEREVEACFDTQIKLTFNFKTYEGGELSDELAQCER